MREPEEGEELDVVCLISVDPMHRYFNISIHFDSTTRAEDFLDHLEGFLNHYKKHPQQFLDDAGIIEPQ